MRKAVVRKAAEAALERQFLTLTIAKNNVSPATESRDTEAA
ncbi:MAG TPA: hypothetical protein VFH68_07905 [Polyangia bacterium]|nr:hypothetical protein [Polyangia bacterium]